MIVRCSFRIVVGASLFVAVAIAVPGCNQDPDQPARDSISAPRNGGGVSGLGDAKGKAPDKPKAGGGKALGGKGDL